MCNKNCCSTGWFDDIHMTVLTEALSAAKNRKFTEMDGIKSYGSTADYCYTYGFYTFLPCVEKLERSRQQKKS